MATRYANPIPDYAALLPRLLPPSFANPLLHLLTTFFGISRTLSEHISPLANKIITQPDVASILVLLAIFFISLKILGMMYRAVIFWVKLALQMVLWGGILVVGLWVYNRGLEGFVEDAQGLIEYWLGQYEMYSQEVKGFQQQKESQIRMKASAQQQNGKGWR
jgi:hypothetical protein